MRYDDFSIFKMAAACHLGFSKLKFLTAMHPLQRHVLQMDCVVQNWRQRWLSDIGAALPWLAHAQASCCSCTQRCMWDRSNEAFMSRAATYAGLKWDVFVSSSSVIAKFHYTGPTGPDRTKSADFVGDPGLQPGSREKVRAGPFESARVRSGPVGPV